ncbi:MAG: FG-GAP-like repeat-containing protein [Chitinophagaceae bacterium]
MNLLTTAFKRLLSLPRSIVLSFTILLLVFSQTFAQPQITVVSPAAAPVGSTVVITGSGFSTTVADNIVWFGPVRATVLTADANSLSVAVPGGSGFQPVSVSVANLTAVSPLAFTTTFAGSSNITAGFYSPKSDISITDNPYSTAAADFDGDGKADIFTIINTGFTISKNNSTPGHLAFGAGVTFSINAPTNTAKAICNDINGDGKLDVLILDIASNTLKIFINTTSAGNFSFAAPVFFLLNLTINASVVAGAVSDMDADGKPDFVLAFSNAPELLVMKNTGSGGVVNFSAGTRVSIGTMVSKAMVIDDLNKDGKPDIAVITKTNTQVQNDSLFVFTNNSAGGSMSFLPRIGLSSADELNGLASGDLDRDGFADLVVITNSSPTLNTYMNTGSATINFVNRPSSSAVVFRPTAVGLTDMNGDGLVDIAVAYFGNGMVSLFPNGSSQGNPSFQSNIDVFSGYGTTEMFGTDWDGDGKTDFTTSNMFSNTVSIFQPAAGISNGRLGTCASYTAVLIDESNNTAWVPLTDSEGNLIAAINANGNNLGLVDYTLFVTDGVPREDASGRLFLNRNIAINPTAQPGTPVDLRIYLTRTEFETLQAAVNSRGVASGVVGINDLAIYKNENRQCDAALQPATGIVRINGKLYADGYVLEASISSFSTFYLASAAQSALPLTLLSFNARQVNGNLVLNWVSTNERNTSFFLVERSLDGTRFESIGKVLARNSSGENAYLFTDSAAFSSTVVYYRLRQVDLDDKFVYAAVLTVRGVNTTRGGVTVFPNPVRDVIQLQMNLPGRQQVGWTITDNHGRAVQRGTLAAPAGVFSTQILPLNLRAGMYYLVLQGSNFEQRVKLVKID